METWWGVLALVLLCIEMLTGSYYLLAVAVGAGCGAVAAYAGLDLNLQVGTAAMTSCFAVYLAHRQCKKVLPKCSESDDIGQTVVVVGDAQGRELRVKYRGTEWQARLKEGVPKGQREYVIRAQHGSVLILDEKQVKE